MQPGLHVGFRNSENGGDFFHAQVLNIPQNDHLAVSRAERIDGVLHGFLHFTLFEQLRGYRAPVSKILRPEVSAFILSLIVDRLVQMKASPLQFHPGFVIGNLQEPGAEL